MASKTAVASAVRAATAARRPAVAAAAASCVYAIPSTSRALMTAAPAALARIFASSNASCRGAAPLLLKSAAAAAAAGARRYSVDAASPTKIWTFADIQKQLDTNEDKNVVFVDVREPAELHETGKIPGAINIPVTTAVQSLHVPEQEFEEMYGYERPGKDKTLVFYCKAGVRARTAAGLALHAGWTSVGEYRGSWLDWAENQGPVEKVNGGK
ncbi:Thiosulfate sulfurtransferase RDL2, mitochondrial [Beauveria bassiana]|uniref:Thiosulfate sulfurtransferase RDL2, mitochondrial n=1 Tax=Beauveria bassiana TaxID=176275 RepID=A0A2N6NVF2_BEABA|nr:Thiosulfate sulfurtransferase RDL2, mitochondrial [Beauveria bassiana]